MCIYTYRHTLLILNSFPKFLANKKLPIFVVVISQSEIRCERLSCSSFQLQTLVTIALASARRILAVFGGQQRLPIRFKVMVYDRCVRSTTYCTPWPNSQFCYASVPPFGWPKRHGECCGGWQRGSDQSTYATLKQPSHFKNYHCSSVSPNFQQMGPDFLERFIFYCEELNSNKEFCVLHVQSNTTIFYLLVH